MLGVPGLDPTRQSVVQIRQGNLAISRSAQPTTGDVAKSLRTTKVSSGTYRVVRLIAAREATPEACRADATLRSTAAVGSQRFRIPSPDSTSSTWTVRFSLAMLRRALARLGRALDLTLHGADDATSSDATLGIDCLKALLSDVVDPLALKLGFTRQQTGCWSTIIAKRSPT